jgi:transposase InsO family protein
VVKSAVVSRPRWWAVHSTEEVRTPQANAFCERLIGTMRRECLDWLIPIHEGHLRSILREWVTHYNRGRRMPA